MKKFVFLILLTLALTACSPTDLLPTQPVETEPVEPTEIVTAEPTEPVEPTLTPEPTPRGADEAVQAAIQYLAQQLGVNPNEIAVVAVTEENWSSSCLGIPAAGEMCMDVITPGYAVQLLAQDEYFTCHTDRTGRAVRVLPTAVAAARQALIELTGLPLSQVRLVSFEAVEWRDSCLGVVTPGVGCLTVITPGYSVIFDAAGGTYEYHTNQDGSQLVLASAPTRQSPGILLSWSSPGEPCQAIQASTSQVDVGPCGGALTPASFYAWTRQQELAAFASLYAPFEAQTAAGLINLAGTGRVLATPAEQRMLAAWGQAVYNEAIGGRGGAAWGLVLGWQRVGGIAGFCDDVAVYLSGEVVVSSCQAGASQPGLRLRLDSWQLSRLYRLVDSLAHFEYIQSDPATADAMTISYVFAGSGTAEAAQDDQRFLLDLGTELAGQLSPADDPAGVALALQALEGYLAALATGDYAGAVARFGSSYEGFAANNPAIDPQDYPALFEAACTVNGYVCNLSVRSVTHIAMLSPGSFRFLLELQNPDGALFELGPCCGEEPLDAPPMTQFAFLVALVEGSYRVLSEPIFIP